MVCLEILPRWSMLCPAAKEARSEHGRPYGRTKVITQRTLSSSFLGLPYRILNINHKKEQLRGLGGEPKNPIPLKKGICLKS